MKVELVTAVEQLDSTCLGGAGRISDVIQGAATILILIEGRNLCKVREVGLDEVYVIVEEIGALQLMSYLHHLRIGSFESAHGNCDRQLIAVFRRAGGQILKLN